MCVEYRWALVGGAAAVALGVVLSAGRAAGGSLGCTFYVRAGFVPAGGAGVADGRSPATALARIGDAAQLVNNPGQVVCVGPGAYREGNIRIPTDGGPNAPIALAADPTGASTGDPPGAVTLQPPVGVSASETPAAAFEVLARKYIAIEGFTIVGFSDSGIHVRSPNGDPRSTANVTIRNNVILGNLTGVLLRSATDVLVVNNLIYANFEDGIAAGTGDQAAVNVTVLNNTIYRNGGWGIRLGDGNVTSPNGRVLNNIINENGYGGIAVARPSTCGYVAGFNVVYGSSPYGPATPANTAYDIRQDPVFIDPAGADGVLGWEFVAGDFVDRSADDDFRLQPGVGTGSPAIDAGYATAAELGIEGSNVEGEAADSGPVNLGYHYGAAPSQAIALMPPDAFMPIYVRVSGSDRSNGKNPGQAKASIMQAAKAAKAGVTVIVGPGTYAESNVGPSDYSGRVAFQGDAPGTATGDAPGLVLIDPSLLPPGRSKDTGFLITNSCAATIEGFHVRFATDAGVQVRQGSHGTVLRGNVVFSNSRGIDIIDSDDVSVINNLVYDNDTGAIQIGGSDGSRRARIQNNTCYGNVDGNGLSLGGNEGTSSGARIEFNIFGNNGKNGINARDGYTGRYNLLFANPVGNYGGVAERAEGDRIDIDPLFVDPAGPDGRQGGLYFADDRFELRQTAAGQDVTSPAVDLGPISAAQAGLDTGTTRTDGAPDTGAVDLGFHAPSRPAEVLYVDVDGDDANGGRAEQVPLRTIREALRRADAGTRVEVAPGLYEESGLRPGASVTVVGAGPERSVVSAAGGTTVFDVREDDVTIARLGVTGARDAGVRGRGDRLLLADTWVYDNAERGVVLPEGTGAFVFNNVIADNGTSGIVVGSATTGALRATLAHNTVYGNGAFGMSIGFDSSTPSDGAAVVNNVIAGNRSGGVAAGQDSTVTLQAGYNCNDDGYDGLARPDTDVLGDPRLLDPSGRDFHLAQLAAGQEDSSACVDAGWRQAAQLELHDATTRSDGGLDWGAVDAGYHYGLTAIAGNIAPLLRFGTPYGDCDDDGATRINDVILAINIALGYESVDACEVVDANGDGQVTIDEVLGAVTASLEQ